MYRIIIDGEIFKGKRTIEQHKIVNEVIMYCDYCHLNYYYY